MENTYDSVQNYYGKVLGSSKDLKTSACTAAGRPHPLVRELIRKVPNDINDRFYGCGAPIPLGIEGGPGPPGRPPARRIVTASAGPDRRDLRLAGSWPEPPRLTSPHLPRASPQVFASWTWAAAPGVTATWRRRWWASPAS